MLLHVEPDELIAAGHRLSEDGPALRALATLVSGCGGLARAAGLADSGRRYGDVEDRLAVMGRRIIG